MSVYLLVFMLFLLTGCCQSIVISVYVVIVKLLVFMLLTGCYLSVITRLQSTH